MTAQVCQAACRCSLTSTHSHAYACTHKHKTLLWSAYLEMTQHLLAFHCHWCPCCLPWALPLAQSHIMDINKESGREKKQNTMGKRCLKCMHWLWLEMTLHIAGKRYTMHDCSLYPCHTQRLALRKLSFVHLWREKKTGNLTFKMRRQQREHMQKKKKKKVF